VSTASCFTIVRNEELLIAKHLVGLAQLTDDVVCVVQPSKDSTVQIARHVGQQLADFGVTVRVMEHTPPKMGKEHSLRFALAECHHEWCLDVDADETYVGASPGQIIDELGAQCEAFSIARWHAVAAHEGRWLKVEPWSHRVRLVNKRRVPGTFTFDVHVGLDHAFHGRPVTAIDQRVARLLEYKAPWQHYVDQLFYDSRGSLNDKALCEAQMAAPDLAVGKAYFDGFYR
jgi:glycosyltransferase involved in cell wall biosynthesis